MAREFGEVVHFKADDYFVANLYSAIGEAEKHSKYDPEQVTILLHPAWKNQLSRTLAVSGNVMYAKAVPFSDVSDETLAGFALKFSNSISKSDGFIILDPEYLNALELTTRYKTVNVTPDVYELIVELAQENESKSNTILRALQKLKGTQTFTVEIEGDQVKAVLELLEQVQKN